MLGDLEVRSGCDTLRIDGLNVVKKKVGANRRNLKCKQSININEVCFNETLEIRTEKKKKKKEEW